MTETNKYRELKARFQEICREKQTLESIIETIEDGFIETDLKGKATRFNKANCDICGYPPDEVNGLS